MAAPAPPAPDPVTARHPEPQVVWTSADGRYAGTVYAYSDGRCTFDALARRGRQWHSVSSVEEMWEVTVRLLADEHARQRARAEVSA